MHCDHIALLLHLCFYLHYKDFSVIYTMQSTAGGGGASGDTDITFLFIARKGTSAMVKCKLHYTFNT